MSTTLEPGTYRLNRNVTNPRPDRRANQSRITSWEDWVNWPEGMLFVVTIDPEFPAIARIRPQGGIGQMSRHDAAFPLLASSLERVDEKPSDFILRNGSGLVQYYALEVLDRLGVSIHRVAEIMRDLDNENEEEVATQGPKL